MLSSSRSTFAISDDAYFTTARVIAWCLTERGRIVRRTSLYRACMVLGACDDYEDVSFELETEDRTVGDFLIDAYSLDEVGWFIRDRLRGRAVWSRWLSLAIARHGQSAAIYMLDYTEKERIGVQVRALDSIDRWLLPKLSWNARRRDSGRKRK